MQQNACFSVSWFIWSGCVKVTAWHWVLLLCYWHSSLTQRNDFSPVMFTQWWVTCVWNSYSFIELKFCFSLTFFFLLFTKKSLKEIMNSPHVFEGCMQISCDLKVKYLLMEQNKARCSAAVLLHDISPQQQRPWSQHVRNKATRWTSEPQQEVRLFVDLWLSDGLFLFCHHLHTTTTSLGRFPEVLKGSSKDSTPSSTSTWQTERITNKRWAVQTAAASFQSCSERWGTEADQSRR